MIALDSEKWWDEKEDKELIDQYSLLSLLLTLTFHLNEQEYLKLEELLKNSPKGTKFKITIERNEPEDSPWVRLAGKYEDDPQYEEVLEHIEAYRRDLDEAVALRELYEKDEKDCEWQRHHSEHRKELAEVERERKEDEYWTKYNQILDEREARYYDDCYQIVEERMYDL